MDTVSWATCDSDMMSEMLAVEGVVAAFGDNALSPNQSLGGEQDLQGFTPQNNAVFSQDPTQICPLAGGLGGSLKVVANGAQGFQAVEVRIPKECVPGAAGGAVPAPRDIKAGTGPPTPHF